MSQQRTHPLWLWITVGSAAIVIYSIAVPVNAVLYQVPVAIAFVLSAFTAGSLPLSLSRPRAALAFFVIGLLGNGILAGDDRDPFWPGPVPVLEIITLAVLIGLIVYSRGWRLGAVAWLLALATATAIPSLSGRSGFPTMTGAEIADLIVTFSIAAAAYVIALLIAGRVTIRDELAREKEVSAEEQARRQLVEERSRIARELHDVVAHSMSVIQVQASTAKYRLTELNDPAIAEFDDIAASARSALAEMRRLLGTLRPDGEEAERMPQRTIGDIPGLVESARRSGVPIDLSIDDELRGAPLSVQVAAFRIVQEAISNALRHAPGSRVSVGVARGNTSGAVISVINSAPDGVPVDAAGGGHGLIGMRERTTALDGHLETHATPDGGWLVHAVLPFDAEGSVIVNPEGNA
ncbi:sensor histidine kinase [Paramicrobacterium agarici]|uniref:sensor histidine kinase n=1 Tax=Paramicrobacterium agarici TaxID=630514 RepID=UPI001152E836|nr:sensor histidine kinase [Microbacterium agarici]TQO23414.1 signal transduction histidine kinase [Microbacterium agarici]